MTASPLNGQYDHSADGWPQDIIPHIMYGELGKVGNKTHLNKYTQWTSLIETSNNLK